MKRMKEALAQLRSSIPIHTSIMIPSQWLNNTYFGFFISILQVIIFIVLFRCSLFKEFHFIWIPFCLISVAVGFVWGVGPGLFATLLGFFAFNVFVIPQSNWLTFDVWHDIRILGPFVVAQAVIAFLAVENAVKHRRVHIAQQTIQSYAQQLQTTNNELAQANALKDYFLTRVAHELRTPLTTILGETQRALRRLRRKTYSIEDCQHSFERVEIRAKDLRNLIECVISIGSLRTGETRLYFEICDFGQICSSAIEHIQAQMGRQIIFQCPPEPLLIRGAHEWLSQAITNLIQNSVQYAYANTVIQASITIDERSVVFEIQDEGPGLSDEQRIHLFEPFYRTPFAEHMFQQGLGLGLTISKEVIERHQGHIWVESIDERKTAFFVSLPRIKDDELHAREQA